MNQVYRMDLIMFERNFKINNYGIITKLELKKEKKQFLLLSVAVHFNK